MAEQFNIENLSDEQLAELAQAVEAEAGQDSNFQAGDRVESKRNGLGTVVEVESPLSVHVEFDNGKSFLVSVSQLKHVENEAKIIEVDFRKKTGS